MNRPSLSAVLVLGLAAVIWSPQETIAQAPALPSAPAMRAQPSASDTYL